VPEEELRHSFESVPQAVEELSCLADLTAHVENIDVPRLVRIEYRHRCSRGGCFRRAGGEAATWDEVESCFRQVPWGLGPDTLRTFVDGLALSHDIVVVSKSYCSYCVKARRLVESLVGPGRVHTLELDLLTLDGAPMPGLDRLRTSRRSAPMLLQRELERKSGVRTVPQVFVRGQFVGTHDTLLRLSRDGLLAETLMPDLTRDTTPDGQADAIARYPMRRATTG